MGIVRAALWGAGAYAASTLTDVKKERPGVNAAIGIGTGLIVYLLEKSGDPSGGTSDEITGDDSKLTYPKNQYKVFADGIEAAIWGSGAFAQWWEDDDTIASILMQMKNIDDVYELIGEYGVRNVGVFLEDGGNLVQMIEEYLDDDLKDEVNRYYRAKRIDFLWP